MKKKIKLITLNPNNLHNTSTYLLKAYAEKNEIIREKCEIELQFFDAIYPVQSNAEELYLQQIMDNNPEVIGFSTYCWNIDITLRLIKKLKLLLPTTVIFLGGPEATGQKKLLMQQKEEIDYIISGEGEISFEKFLLFLVGEINDIEEVSNLVWRKNTSIIENKYEYIENLDEIPMIYSERIADPNLIGGALYSFETKRGCEYNCTYCLHHKGFHNIREFSLEYVFRELDILFSSNLKYIWIIDPCFNENEERSIKILDYINEHNYKNIEFGFEIRNETMSIKFIKKICSMKCIRFIAVGLQTLSEKSLDAVNRRLNERKFEENIAYLKKYSRNLTIHVDLIYGLPLQTLAEYKESIDYVLELECEIFSQPLKVLPGAELSKQIYRYGIEYDINAPYTVIQTKHFRYEDMHNAFLINGILNVFQSNSMIQEALREVKKRENINYSALFQQIGEYIWEKGYVEIFANYYKISYTKLVNVLCEAVKNLYNGKFVCETKNEELVQLDWGSIAMQIELI